MTTDPAPATRSIDQWCITTTLSVRRDKGHALPSTNPSRPLRSPPSPSAEQSDRSMATMASDSLTRRFAVACGVLSQYVRAGGVGAPAAVLPPGAAQEGCSQAQQLTIFYGGRVVVLDGCPPEKAAELIRLAAAAQAPREPALVDMPIARKASLRRFLAKRKDRATAAASAGRKDGEPEPEPAEPLAKKGKVDAGGEEGASTWLALGSMHAR